MQQFPVGMALLVFFGLVLFFKWINILNEYERGVVFRLGRVLSEAKGPGFVFVFWPIDRMVKVSLRTVVLDIPPQDVITRDNVSVKVNAVVYFRIMNPTRAIVEIENYAYATSQLAQTTLRSILGEVELDDLLSQRDKLNQRLAEVIDKHSDPWGVKVALVARQAEAEREKRAKIIHAEGEFQAAQRLQDAAAVMQKEPATLQLRYLQTLTEIATEKNSTIIFPLPIDTIKMFLDMARDRK